MVKAAFNGLKSLSTSKKIKEEDGVVRLKKVRFSFLCFLLLFVLSFQSHVNGFSLAFLLFLSFIN